MENTPPNTYKQLTFRIGVDVKSLFLAILACTKSDRLDHKVQVKPDKIQIEVENQLASLRLGNMKMVVDATFGGRITEFSLNGKNALVSEGAFSSV